MPFQSTANGPLANFRVEVAKSENAREVLEFLFADFLHNEPLNSAVGLTRTECANFFAELVQISLTDGLSYLVRDPTEDGRLVAIRLANIMDRKELTNGTPNGPGPEKDGQRPKRKQSNGQPFQGHRFENDKIRNICGILHSVETKIWSLLPSHIDRLLCWLVISVDANYRRQGIAQALLLHRLDEAVGLGCQGAFTEASAINSQKLFSKLGYTRLFELLLADFRDGLGKQVFRCKDGTDRVTLEFRLFDAL
uniref:aralkylamine N-acetyltransferase n=1 Tax=Globodera rostochiensis TaxID=31243 RepID=A0A914HGA2_GLORO